MNSFVSPFFADLILGLMYLMIVIAIGVTAYSVIHTLRNRQKGDDVVNGVPAGKIGWCVAISLIVCLVATFLLGSTSPVVTNGHLFANRFWLKATDMFIYTSFFLIVGCFISAIVSRFRS